MKALDETDANAVTDQEESDYSESNQDSDLGEHSHDPEVVDPLQVPATLRKFNIDTVGRGTTVVLVGHSAEAKACCIHALLEKLNSDVILVICSSAAMYRHVQLLDVSSNVHLFSTGEKKIFRHTLRLLEAVSPEQSVSLVVDDLPPHMTDELHDRWLAKFQRNSMHVWGSMTQIYSFSHPKHVPTTIKEHFDCLICFQLIGSAAHRLLFDEFFTLESFRQFQQMYMRVALAKRVQAIVLDNRLTFPEHPIMWFSAKVEPHL